MIVAHHTTTLQVVRTLVVEDKRDSSSQHLRFSKTSIVDWNALGEFAHLIESLGDERKPSLQSAIKSRTRKMEPFHDHLVAADALDVIVKQQLSRFRIARARRGCELTDRTTRTLGKPSPGHASEVV